MSDKPIPFSSDAEQHVLACIMLDEGATLTRALEQGLSAASFYSPAHAAIFDTCARLKTPALETVTAELMGNKQLEPVGGIQYLMQVAGATQTTTHATYFIQKVRELHQRRKIIQSATELIERATDGDVGELLQTGAAQLSAIAAGADKSSRSEAIQRLLASRVQSAKPPVEPATRLFLADKPISTAGNITTLISRAKTGKTAALGAATAAIITAASGTSALNQDTFKFRASNPAGHAVIVIDTEQSPYDAFLCYQRSLKRAGESADPAWLHHHAMVGYTVPQLHAALDLAVREHGGIFCVILDGVADFVASVNDEAECNGLVTWLRARSVTYNTPIICVIHSNEAEKSGDDGRGHLGKQLIRKAESNLLLKKVGEITTITSDKQRKAPITEADGVAFKWSDATQMHVSTSAPEPSKRGRKPEYSLQDVAPFIPGPDRPHSPQSVIFRTAESIGIKRDAFNRLLESERQCGSLDRIISPTTGPCFRLTN